MKLWAGRFGKETDALASDFNSSISFDSRMYKEDIEGSIAHATMLGACGIIDKAEAVQIADELKKIRQEIDSGSLTIDFSCEDIHTFIEKTLTERLGDAGKRLHTARSRNDQVALDLRLYLKKEGGELRALILSLIRALVEKAHDNIETVMPGYTHLQRAQPVTLCHHLLAYCEMLKRDLSRLDDWDGRLMEMPLGAGALAGTTYPIDREMTASLLNLGSPTKNSLDSVSDRDFAIELCSLLSIIMMHLSRLSEEIILWCSAEFSFIELDDAYSTGSSIMPQKKNPDMAELVRGKTGRVYGRLIGLLTMMKGLPLAYNKDMQEDKEAIFDAVDTVKACLSVFAPMISTMRVKADAMRKGAAGGFANATDCADYLAKKGLPFRDAYRAVGELVARSIELGKSFEELPLEEFRLASTLFDEDVYEAISLDTCVKERASLGGPAPVQSKARIDELFEYLKKEEGR